MFLAQLGRFALTRFAGLLLGQTIAQHPHLCAFATLGQVHQAHHFFQAVGRDVLHPLFQVDRLAPFLFQVQLRGRGALQQQTLTLLRQFHGASHGIARIRHH